jgi:acetyltransferase-like isoleucine patch superfamily enzyme
LKKSIKFLLFHLPIVKHFYRTQDTAAPITFRYWFIQKILGFNKEAYWPTHHSSIVSGVENIEIGIGTAPGLGPGCYIQGGGKIVIGDYTIVAPNVGIISANHSIYDYTKQEKEEVHIGKYCWLGMNSVIMPGVTLGDHTIVAAGAVVTKKFEEGYCVVAGNPARIIKILDKSLCVEKQNRYKYRGYIYRKNK